MKPLTITQGDKFGYWTVLHFHGVEPSGPWTYMCQCRCGTIRVIRGTILAKKRSEMCLPCAIRRMSRKKFSTSYAICENSELRQLHRRRIRNLIRRCYDPSDKAYKHYGGRGISVHEPWLRDKDAFLRYLVSLPDHDKPKMTLDRINNDGNYEPGNLRFATRKTQRLNQRKPQPERTGVR